MVKCEETVVTIFTPIKIDIIIQETQFLNFLQVDDEETHFL